MLNPFLLAGLVFTGIGLVQEAMDADTKTPPVNKIKSDKPAPVTVNVTATEVKKPKVKAAPVVAASDG